MLAGKAFFAVLAATLANAGPIRLRADGVSSSADASPASSAPGGQATGSPADLSTLAAGNKQFMAGDVFKNLTKTKTTDPSFMVLGCADSNVGSDTVFGNQGNIFHQDNIANQYSKNDTSADAAVTYAMTELGATHIVVMGHYGCSSVASAMSAGSADQSGDGKTPAWTTQLQQLYQTSDRPEIVAARKKQKRAERTDKLQDTDPAFVAMVEENIKASVKRIHDESNWTKVYGSTAPSFQTVSRGSASSSAGGPEVSANVRRAEGSKPTNDVYVHGLVYNATSGEVMDLGVSFGPTKDIPKIPFPAVQGAAKQFGGHGRIITKTVTISDETVTVTATASGSAKEATVTTSIKDELHTITVTASGSASAGASASSGASESGSAGGKPKTVTRTVTVDDETVTVTATASAGAPDATVTTTVKGQEKTITVPVAGGKSEGAPRPSETLNNGDASPSSAGDDDAAPSSQAGGDATPTPSEGGQNGATPSADAPAQSTDGSDRSVTDNVPPPASQTPADNDAPNSSADNDAPKSSSARQGGGGHHTKSSDSDATPTPSPADENTAVAQPSSPAAEETPASNDTPAASSPDATPSDATPSPDATPAPASEKASPSSSKRGGHHSSPPADSEPTPAGPSSADDSTPTPSPESENAPASSTKRGGHHSSAAADAESTPADADSSPAGEPTPEASSTKHGSPTKHSSDADASPTPEAGEHSADAAPSSHKSRGHKSSSAGGSHTSSAADADATPEN